MKILFTLSRDIIIQTEDEELTARKMLDYVEMIDREFPQYDVKYRCHSNHEDLLMLKVVDIANNRYNIDVENKRLKHDN